MRSGRNADALGRRSSCSQIVRGSVVSAGTGRRRYPQAHPLILVAEARCAPHDRDGGGQHAAAGLDTAVELARLVAIKGTQMAAKSDNKTRIVAQNRKARFNYQIGETFEAGIALTGTEVKSLRSGKATIAESYADARGGEIWLVNANIPEYLQGGRFNHAPKRMRKLLLHRRQINKLMGAVEREGMTLVPLKLYFNEKGRAKLELALARGKKLHDKRESEKRRSWERERGRLLRAKG
jgi:SsrA-binding protein